jgi:hypothetical protein
LLPHPFLPWKLLPRLVSACICASFVHSPYMIICRNPIHLRRHLQHFFESISKVMYLCYFSKILYYFFRNLFRLNKNLFHLSKNYMITPINMCVRDNICCPTSHRDSIKARLCCSAAILCCFHHIMNERVANSDSLIIFSAPTYFFDLNWRITTHARGRFTQ